MEEYDKVQALLPKLSRKELQLVVKQGQALLSLGGASKKLPEDTRDDWLLDGILYYLDRIGLSSIIPSDFRIRSAKSYAAYFDRSKNVRDYFENAIPNLSRQHLLALGRLLAKSLAEYLHEFMPVTLMTLLNNVGQVIEAFENAFPGYLEAGMLPLLILALESSSKGNPK